MTDILPIPEIIDAWNRKPRHGVDIRTKNGAWRCVAAKVDDDRFVGYATIRAEGQSSMGRLTFIRAADIVQARGWIV